MARKLLIGLAIVALVCLMMPLKAEAGSLPGTWDPYEMIVNVTRIGVVTLDPANCYDTASATLLFNEYETLIFFDGERYDYFIPQLAEQVWVAPPDPAAPIYTNFTVYFKIRPGVKFHTWCRSDLEPVPSWPEYEVTTEDVEYSFERWMVYDYVGGPQWMIYEPLLSCYGADPEDPEFGAKIDNAVQRNATHVWLNIANKDLAPRTGITPFAPIPMFETTGDWAGRQRKTFWDEVGAKPLGYPLRIFFQVISQSWASIMSKRWLLEYVDPLAEAAGHPTGEWPQTWENWTLYHYPTSPLGPELPCVDMIPAGAAKPGVTCGTGPFILQRFSALDYSQVRYENYWRGWPADWPNPPSPDSCYTKPQGIKPIGYVNRVTYRTRAVAVGIAEFKEGAADFTTIPRAYAPQVHVGNDRNGPTLPGIRLNFPIPVLAIDTFHMTLDIEPTEDNLYGKIYDKNVLAEDGIPRNFFANKDVRYAFAYLINWTMVIKDLLLGEAYQPWTVAPTGLPYVPTKPPKFSYDEGKAEQHFRAATFDGKKLTDYGFTVYIMYNSENVIRQAIAEQLAASINKVGVKIYAPEPSKFHAEAKGVPWEEYIPAMDAHELPNFFIGWLADYADPHNFFFPYCHSQGTFAHAQRYSNPAIDEQLDKGVYTPDGPLREAIYTQVENLFLEDSPTIPIFVAVGRGYMRDWVQGWYYNPLYPGGYFYNKWKWPMLETPDDCVGIIPNGYWVGDKDFDCKVSMDDIMKVLRGFGSYAGKAGMPVFHPRWNFHLDVDDMPKYRWRDRKIDTGDLVVIIKYFGKTSTGWQPPP